MKKDNGFFRLGFFLINFLAACHLSAGAVFWIGPDGDWNTQSNWSSGNVPGPDDDVIISGAIVTHSENNHTIKSISCANTFKISGGTVQVTGNTQLPSLNISGGEIDCLDNDLEDLILSGGALGGTNMLTGTVEWTGGGLAGGSVTAVTSSASVSMDGSNPKQVFGALTNEGTISWAGTGDLQVQTFNSQTGFINNMPGAIFDVENNQSITTYYGGGFVSNAGLWTVTAGGGAATAAVVFYNTGTIDVLNGTLVFDSDLSGSGSLVAESDATVSFATLNDGNFHHYSGQSLEGSGEFLVAGIHASLSFAGPVENLVLSNGTTTGFGGFIQNLTWNGGTLSGTNSVTGEASWMAGGMGANSILLIASNSVMNLTGPSDKGLFGSLTNTGTVNWGGTGNISLQSSTSPTGAIYNGASAIFNINTARNINSYYGGGSFVNAGQVNMNAGNSTVTITLPLNNNGILHVITGTLVLEAVNGTGTFNVDEGGTISFSTVDDSDFRNFSGQALTGAGTYFVAGQKSTVAFGGNVQSLILTGGALNGFNGVIQSLTWNGGALSGTNTISGMAAWTSGSMASQSELTIAPAAVLNISGNAAKGVFGLLANQGTINLIGTGNLQLQTPSSPTGIISNLSSGTFNVQADQSFTTYYGGGSINNNGKFKKFGTLGTTTIGVPFNNSGEIEVDGGQLAFGSYNFSQNGGPVTITLNGTNSGQFGALTAINNGSLNGKLTVDLGPHFAAPIGSLFQILSSVSRTGTFFPANLPSGMGILYSNTGVFLVVTNATPIQLATPRVLGTRFAFDFPTVVNESYSIRECTNLATTNWIFVTNIIGTGSTCTFSNAVVPGSSAFFRVSEP